jgi:hypothetical protein
VDCRLQSITRPKGMLKIQRASNGVGAFSVSGRIEMEDIAELQRLIGSEEPGQGITLDLQDVTLVDRDAVKFLAHWEADSIKLENCPAYIRKWIDTERNPRPLRTSFPGLDRSQEEDWNGDQRS